MQAQPWLCYLDSQYSPPLCPEQSASAQKISTFLTWQEKMMAWNIDLWLPINLIYLVFAAAAAIQV